jgi:hypothetical protein
LILCSRQSLENALEYDDKSATLNVKTLKGQGEVALHDGATSTNPGVLLSLTNQLQFLGDYDVPADGIIGTLPIGYRPKSVTAINYLTATKNNVTRQSYVIISPDGTLNAEPGGTVHTTGIVVNLPGDWY